MREVVIPPPTTYDQAVEQFHRVHQMKAVAVQEIEETESGDQLLLVYDDGSQQARPGHAFLADRRDLVELARQILAKLDPVTNEQLLEKMQGLVEDHE